MDDNTTTNSGGNKAKKNSFRAIELTNLPSEILASHVNYFLEPLYCAERCWAASLALKAQMTTVIENNDTANANTNNALGSDGMNPRKDWSVGNFVHSR